MGKLERPIVRWAIASLFFAVELLFLVVIPDPGESSRYEITPFNQAIITVVLLMLFAIVPSILKEFASKDRPLAYAVDQVETTQQRRMRDHLLELDMQGIIDAQKKAGGSVGGPVWHFELQVNDDVVIDVLKDMPRLESIDFDNIGSNRASRLGEYS